MEVAVQAKDHVTFGFLIVITDDINLVGVRFLSVIEQLYLLDQLINCRVRRCTEKC